MVSPRLMVLLASLCQAAASLAGCSTAVDGATSTPDTPSQADTLGEPAGSPDPADAVAPAPADAVAPAPAAASGPCLAGATFAQAHRPISVDAQLPRGGGLLTPRLVWDGAAVGIFWETSAVERPGTYFARMSIDGTFQVGPKLLWEGALASSPVWTGEEYGVVYRDLSFVIPTLSFVRVDSDGELLDDEPFPLATSSSATQNFVAQLVHGEGGYTVLWRENTGEEKTYYKRIDPARNVFGPGVEFGRDVILLTGVMSDRLFRIYVHDLIDSPDGIAMTLTRYSESESSYWLVLLNEWAEPVLAHKLPMDPGWDVREIARLVWTGTGFAVIYSAICQANRDCQLEGENQARFEVFFTLVDSLDGPGQVQALASGSGVYPDFAYSGSDYGIVWQQVGNGPISFTRLLADGTLDEEQGVVLAGDIRGAGDFVPNIAWAGDRYVVSWTSYGTAYQNHVVIEGPDCPK